MRPIGSFLLQAALLAVSLVPGQSLPSNKMAEKKGDPYRLPRSVAPTLYDIRMLPFVEVGNFTTHGHVDIFVDCLQATDSITLNSADLTIDWTSATVLDVTNNNSPLVMAGHTDEQVTRQMITMQTRDKLEVGKKYRISIDFVSILNDQLVGFYRSSYVEGGVTKYLAVSQFEATDARRAFPCFDEPDMKANFSIVLGRKKDWMSASNMNRIGTNNNADLPNYVWDTFATSPAMSTYLVAFLVAEYATVSLDTKVSNVPISFLVRPSFANQTSYAMGIVAKEIEFYENYLGIDYPLPKQDMATIPDKANGGMENWGLITFRETAGQGLFLDNATASEAEKQAMIIGHAHELAHNWFGDLVTMKWWNDLFLNEGFAFLMQYVTADAVEPDFRVMEQFIVDVLHFALSIDDVDSSHPLSAVTLATPEEIWQHFDGIAYTKGASVLRMLSSVLGPDTFKAGLNRYLTNMAYANAVPDDLWQAMDDQATADNVDLPTSVKAIMGSWISVKNYPLITVTRDYSGTNSAHVTQERFLKCKSCRNESDSTDYRWWVPLTYSMNFNEPTESVWMSSQETYKFIASLDSSKWVIFNVDGQNYYRVTYDETNYGMLTEQLLENHTAIPSQSRAQLLDDAFNLALAKVIPYESALDLSQYLEAEREYVPWKAVLDQFDYVDNMLYSQPEHADWKKYLTHLVGPYYESVGFNETGDDTHLAVLSRTNAVSWACRVQIASCVDNVALKFGDLMRNPETALSPNQKAFVLSAGVELGGQAEWDFALSQYRDQQNNDYLIPITRTRLVNKLYNLLEMMLNPTSGIRRADVDTLFKSIASNTVGNPLALDFLVNRWNDIEQSLGTGYFVNFFRYVCDKLNTVDKLDTLMRLRDDHVDILGGSSRVDEGLRVVRNNIEWLSLHQKTIGAWLVKELDPTTPTTTSTTTQSSANIVHKYGLTSALMITISFILLFH